MSTSNINLRSTNFCKKKRQFNVLQVELPMNSRNIQLQASDTAVSLLWAISTWENIPAIPYTLHPFQVFSVTPLGSLISQISSLLFENSLLSPKWQCYSKYRISLRKHHERGKYKPFKKCLWHIIKLYFCLWQIILFRRRNTFK